jgi:hypothetical protein
MANGTLQWGPEPEHVVAQMRLKSYLPGDSDAISDFSSCDSSDRGHTESESEGNESKKDSNLVNGIVPFWLNPADGPPPGFKRVYDDTPVFTPLPVIARPVPSTPVPSTPVPQMEASSTSTESKFVPDPAEAFNPDTNVYSCDEEFEGSLLDPDWGKYYSDDDDDDPMLNAQWNNRICDPKKFIPQLVSYASAPVTVTSVTPEVQSVDEDSMPDMIDSSSEEDSDGDQIPSLTEINDLDEDSMPDMIDSSSDEDSDGDHIPSLTESNVLD